MSKRAQQRRKKRLKRIQEQASLSPEAVNDEGQPPSKKAPRRKLTEDAWMSWRTGLLLNGLVSLALALFVGWQVFPVGGLKEAVRWGLIAGLSIWVVFFLTLRFTLWIRRSELNR
ncbi:MAG TPA: hypothetical protein ENK56_07440 [Chloroflexi bacterium]|nr:hypothetical protein [Chloroflexota bacterium]